MPFAFKMICTGVWHQNCISLPWAWMVSCCFFSQCRYSSTNILCDHFLSCCISHMRLHYLPHSCVRVDILVMCIYYNLHCMHAHSGFYNVLRSNYRENVNMHSSDSSLQNFLYKCAMNSKCAQAPIVLVLSVFIHELNSNFPFLGIKWFTHSTLEYRYFSANS